MGGPWPDGPNGLGGRHELNPMTYRRTPSVTVLGRPRARRWAPPGACHAAAVYDDSTSPEAMLLLHALASGPLPHAKPGTLKSSTAAGPRQDLLPCGFLEPRPASCLHPPDRPDDPSAMLRAGRVSTGVVASRRWAPGPSGHPRCRSLARGIRSHPPAHPSLGRLAACAGRNRWTQPGGRRPRMAAVRDRSKA